MDTRMLFLLAILLGGIIAMTIFCFILIRRHSREAGVWRRDWRNARKTIRLANAEAKRLVNNYNEHVSSLISLTESLSETAFLLSRYSDLENEEVAPEDDLYPKGIASAALLQTIWEQFPKSLIGNLPTTKSFIDAFGVTSADIDEMAGDNQDKPGYLGP